MADLLGRLQSSLADRYLIERELGRGGMAIVYLAEDRKHQRRVALKVLRPELAASLGAERFLREIRTAAQLTHPNILPLFDSGEADGTLYYTMPYVEGDSLRDRLNREKQLPIEDALQITKEVADALGYAHEQGIVHRDIKPENILFQRGHALVADFGIARAVSAAGAETLTETGLAVGTPAYMSPEQGTGAAELDGRSDLYSLGCVLYEMLSGEPPYTGPTAQAILARKLTDPLPPVTTVRETVPRPVEAALAKVLAKNPVDRYATAAQFTAALTQSEMPASLSGGASSARPGPTVAAGRVPRWLIWVAAVGTLAVVAVLLSRLLPAGSLDITISDITPVTSEPGVEFQPAISPDGNEVAFVAGPIRAPHMVIRSTTNVAGGGEVRLGDRTSGSEWFPSWSADGQLVRFRECREGWGSRCDWKETGKLGGAVRPATVPLRANWPAWSPDGARVAFVIGDTVFVSSRGDTGMRRVAVQKTAWSSLHSLAWSPDGTQIAWVNSNALWQFGGNVAPSSIWIVNADGGEPQPVAEEVCLNVSPAWLDARHLLFVSNRDGPRGLYVVEVGKDGARTEPRALPGVADPHSISYSIAARRLVYAKLTLRQNIWSYALERSSPVSIRDGIPVTTGSQVIESHDVSPDGNWIAYDNDLRGDMDVYKVSLTGGAPVPLTSSQGDEMGPRWSPDGTEIAFSAFFPGHGQEVMVVSAEGGTTVALTNSPEPDYGQAWSPDGLNLVFGSRRTGRWEAWLLSRDSVGGVWHEAGQLTTDFRCDLRDWAPDGSGVLCNVGSDLVLVSPQGHTIWRRNLNLTSGLVSYGNERYSRDGGTIYIPGRHQDGRDGVWALPVAGGEARLVIAFDDPAVTARGLLSVGPDRLYLTVSQYESDILVANLRY